jgi:phosphatidylglycerophosphate synthase
MGLGLILVVSAAYLWHGSALVFGLTLAVAFAFDALDGAVARQTGLSSKTGGYFDAMVDRYQELIVLIAIAWMTGHWALALLAFSGAALTSYAKARTAIEIPISNTDWPDLFERLERIIYLCVMLVLAGITGAAWVMTGGLAIYALLCHATALQRIRRAVVLLNEADQGPR